MVNEWTVRILLECILVTFCVQPWVSLVVLNRFILFIHPVQLNITISSKMCDSGKNTTEGTFVCKAVLTCYLSVGKCMTRVIDTDFPEKDPLFFPPRSTEFPTCSTFWGHVYLSCKLTVDLSARLPLFKGTLIFFSFSDFQACLSIKSHYLEIELSDQ